MKVKFKFFKLVSQWQVLAVINPELVYIAMYFIEQLGKGVVTHIKRTDKQQARFYPDKPDSISVHQFWRGIDIRTIGYDKQKVRMAALMTNLKFVYPKVGKKTVIVHDIGLGSHAHLQNVCKIVEDRRKYLA